MGSSEENWGNSTKKAAEVVGELIKAAGETSEAKEASKNIGKTAVTLTEAINNCLLPIATVNFAIKKAKVYFESSFGSDMAHKAAHIESENIIEPKASLAGPIIQGLAFSHEETELKDMYLSLLATSMDKENVSKAHPSFVEVIRQLSPTEAFLLKELYQMPQNVMPICRAMGVSQDRGEIIIYDHVIDITEINTGTPIADDDVPVAIYNWVRLGLVDVDYDRTLLDKSRYEWVEKRPELASARELYCGPEKHVRMQHGIMRKTAFGARFAGAVGITKD